MKLFFIQEYSGRLVYHGGIGNTDAEKIFAKKGFIPIQVPYQYDFSLKAKLGRLLHLFKMFCQLPKDSCVIFQFPLYAVIDKLLVKALQFRRIRIICFLTDIDGIKDGNEELLKKELHLLRRYKYFIVHNETMKQWLISKIGSVVIRHISFFDFLTPQALTERHLSFEIAFAGNLTKSKFLNDLGILMKKSPQIVFNVYGTDPSDSMLQQANVRYMGFYEPYSLPANLKGAFGLVWDGEAIGRPAGSLGNYMKYISHHKLSLYLVSGMPVIVWADGAAAPLVDKFKIGLAINSLYELEEVISRVTPEAYLEMTTNARNISGTISRGERLGQAIEELLAKIQDM